LLLRLLPLVAPVVVLANKRVDNTSSLPTEQLVLELPLRVELDEIL